MRNNMMVKIKDIINELNSWAPPAYQEAYDNSKLIVGDANAEVTQIITALDCTEEVVDEAIRKGANLIVAHHPIVFSGLKSLTGKNYIERTVIKAIKNDIAIFAIHTNLDHVKTGVNKQICDLIGLNKLEILAPKKGLLKKLTTYTPTESTAKVIKALNDAGAGQIGEYKNCAFQQNGIGQFEPSENTSPTIGSHNKLEYVEENKIEVIYSAHEESKVLAALKTAHPYEEVAYYCSEITNTNQHVGSGMIGKLTSPMSENDFLTLLKEKFNLSVIKHTKTFGKPIETVAVCGGSGSFLLQNAISKNADIYITGDFKYHEFFDAEEHLIIADIGHYESEVFTKNLIYEFISKKFPNIAVDLSEISTNPIYYFT